jgi:hypothetical protein
MSKSFEPQELDFAGRKKVKAGERVLATAMAISSMLLLPLELCAQTIAPTASLKSDPPVEVVPQEDFVLQRPAPAAIPFRPTISASAYDAAKQAAEAGYFPLGRKPAPFTPVPAAPPSMVFKNFGGASQIDTTRPPDTEGAAGATQFVETTNSQVNIYNKSDGSLAKSVTLASFFNYTVQALFDPRVVYDPVWKRWIVTADAFAESSSIQKFFIAISKTSNATGAFYIYSPNVTSALNFGDFWDFPQVGFDQDAVIVTANVFNSSNAYRGAFTFAVAKALLYNGRAFSVNVFGPLVGTLAPPIVLDQNANTFLIAAPPSGSTFTKYTMTNSSHPASTALAASNITVPSYSVPAGARQPGTTNLLDTSDSRFVNASTQNGNDLWQVHTISSNGSPTPKFYRINTANNTVSQSGFFFQSSTSDDWNASITANAAGNTFVTWSSTNATNNINAQVVFSGKQSADTAIPAGVVGVTSSTFYNPSTDTTERWGDYSAITVDPSSTSKAWLVNEKVNSTTMWGSQIMQVGF